MTVLRCPRCQRLWVHNCGPRHRFTAITHVCPDCIADVYPMGRMSAPCVCGHEADEHQPNWGCIADTGAYRGESRPCMCAEYEADVVPF